MRNLLYWIRILTAQEYAKNFFHINLGMTNKHYISTKEYQFTFKIFKKIPKKFNCKFLSIKDQTIKTSLKKFKDLLLLEKIKIIMPIKRKTILDSLNWKKNRTFRKIILTPSYLPKNYLTKTSFSPFLSICFSIQSRTQKNFLFPLNDKKT